MLLHIPMDERERIAGIREQSVRIRLVDQTIIHRIDQMPQMRQIPTEYRTQSAVPADQSSAVEIDRNRQFPGSGELFGKHSFCIQHFIPHMFESHLPDLCQVIRERCVLLFHFHGWDEQRLLWRFRIKLLTVFLHFLKHSNCSVPLKNPQS